MLRTRLVLPATLLLTALPAALDAQDYYADVRPLLVENCMGCHTEAGPGWSMEDPEETYGERSRLHRAVTRREMPPWLAESGHQEYMGDLSLDDASVRLLQRWAEAGYPKGDPRPDPAYDGPCSAAQAQGDAGIAARPERRLCAGRRSP